MVGQQEVGHWWRRDGHNEQSHDSCREIPFAPATTVLSGEVCAALGESRTTRTLGWNSSSGGVGGVVGLKSRSGKLGATVPCAITPVKRYDSIGSAPVDEARAWLIDSGRGTFDWGV